MTQRFGSRFPTDHFAGFDRLQRVCLSARYREREDELRREAETAFSAFHSPRAKDAGN
jgi:hypothetical protein